MAVLMTHARGAGLASASSSFSRSRAGRAATPKRSSRDAARPTTSLAAKGGRRKKRRGGEQAVGSGAEVNPDRAVGSHDDGSVGREAEAGGAEGWRAEAASAAAGASASPSAASSSSFSSSSSSSSSLGPSLFESSSGLFAEVAASEDPSRALEALAAAASAAGRERGSVLTDDEGAELLRRLTSGGGTTSQADLAVRIHDAMRSQQAELDGWRWPRATIAMHAALVRGLTRMLRITEAVGAVEALRARGGTPRAAEVAFGTVVACPYCAGGGKPAGAADASGKTQMLAVVQPQEGFSRAACSRCRYEYDLFSGRATRVSTEATGATAGAVRRALNLVGLLRGAQLAAVHELEVLAPDGAKRVFRCGTPTEEVPAAEEERVTVVTPARDRPPNDDDDDDSRRASSSSASSSSSTSSSGARGRNALKESVLAPCPPGWRPGEAMAVTRHALKSTRPLMRAPLSGAGLSQTWQQWALPAAVVVLGGDAATALIDPALPLLVAGGLASVAGAGVATNSLLLPEAARLSERAVELQGARQALLGEHERLTRTLRTLVKECVDEVRILARLFQLQKKMESVDESLYGERMQRVQAAVDGIDARLEARLELIDRHAKVAAMIEIEVEMNQDVAATEFANTTKGIEQELVNLARIEEIQSEWRAQAAASDEVERLLKQIPIVEDNNSAGVI